LTYVIDAALELAIVLTRLVAIAICIGMPAASVRNGTKRTPSPMPSIEVITPTNTETKKIMSRLSGSI
jgi:hypothetical protein